MGEEYMVCEERTVPVTSSFDWRLPKPTGEDGVYSWNFKSLNIEQSHVKDSYETLKS